MTSDEDDEMDTTTYVAVDGHSHRWDDLGEAVKTLAYHYWRLVKTVYADFFRRTR